MCRKFLPTDMYPVFVGTLANPLRSHLHSIGQHIAEAFPLSQFLSHGYDGSVIAPGHFNIIGVFLGDKPMLIALNG